MGSTHAESAVPGWLSAQKSERSQQERGMGAAGDGSGGTVIALPSSRAGLLGWVSFGTQMHSMHSGEVGRGVVEGH